METKRLKIRQIITSDYENIFELYQNDKVRKYLWWVKNEKEFNESFDAFIAPKDNEFYWIILDKTNESFIWFISLSQYHETNDYEISYQLNDLYWWKWYAQEALLRILEFWFTELNLAEIYAETQIKNKPSIKLWQKVWMEVEWELVRHWEKQLVFFLSRNYFFSHKWKWK